MNTDTEDILVATRAKLNDLMSSIESLDPEAGIHDATVKQACRLSQAICATAAQLRQYEKARKREVADIPLDQIIARLKALPELEREKTVRLILGSDDEAPLL